MVTRRDPWAPIAFVPPEVEIDPGPEQMVSVTALTLINTGSKLYAPAGFVAQGASGVVTKDGEGRSLVGLPAVFEVPADEARAMVAEGRAAMVDAS